MAPDGLQVQRALTEMLQQRLPGWSIESAVGPIDLGIDIVASNRQLGAVLIEIKTGHGSLELFHLAQLVAARNDWARRVGGNQSAVRAALVTTRHVSTSVLERAKSYHVDVVSDSSIGALGNSLVEIIDRDFPVAH